MVSRLASNLLYKYVAYLQVLSEIPQGPIIIPIFRTSRSIYSYLPDFSKTTSWQDLLAHMLDLLDRLLLDQAALLSVVVV
jgi:hypothetical protein